MSRRMVRMIAPFGKEARDAVCASRTPNFPANPAAAPIPRIPIASRRVIVMARQGNMSVLAMNSVFADLTLARRLEKTEGRGNAAFVDAQARIDPNSGAIWTIVGGTSAMFAGVGSPI